MSSTIVEFYNTKEGRWQLAGSYPTSGKTEVLRHVDAAMVEAVATLTPVKPA
jgi:hypothetical protein